MRLFDFKNLKSIFVFPVCQGPLDLIYCCVVILPKKGFWFTHVLPEYIFLKGIYLKSNIKSIVFFSFLFCVQIYIIVTVMFTKLLLTFSVEGRF